jgi:hypothetical protein
MSANTGKQASFQLHFPVLAMANNAPKRHQVSCRFPKRYAHQLWTMYRGWGPITLSVLLVRILLLAGALIVSLGLGPLGSGISLHCGACHPSWSCWSWTA